MMANQAKIEQEKSLHTREVERLQKEIRSLQKNLYPITLRYQSDNSCTTRSKSYKKQGKSVDCGPLNRIVEIDPKRGIAVAEPRVTMEELVRATLPYGLIPPIVPECKEITVGGAIMGMAAESGSHRWGCFNDACAAFEILCGDGSLLRASPDENREVFYGIPGSYGSLGVLVSAEIKLIPAKEKVHLRHHRFRDVGEAIQALRKLTGKADFLDGVVFAKDLAVLIEGNLSEKAKVPQHSLKPIHSKWYFQHVKEVGLDGYEEQMMHEDYLFRYDRCCFWMGAYLFLFPLLVRFIGQGILHLPQRSMQWFSDVEIQKFNRVPDVGVLRRTLFHHSMKSRNLWKLLHKAEKWVQDRMVIQDFCIPETKVERFLEDALSDPGVFPIWLCPIKGTKEPQIFAPHLLTEKAQDDHFINIGIYGVPSYSSSLEIITRKLEEKTTAYGGRKVLYSRSYFTQDQFWKIYSRKDYELLREKTHAKNVWQDITEKVLSE